MAALPGSADYTELDYALRAEGGWAHEAWSKRNAAIYVAERSGEVIAFSLLVDTDEAAAEFRIALRADMLGKRLGGVIAKKTLLQGFEVSGLSTIHLIVRKSSRADLKRYPIQNGDGVSFVYSRGWRNAYILAPRFFQEKSKSKKMRWSRTI